MLMDIKNRAEWIFHGNKMIVYDPLHPWKNVSITLISTYRKFWDFRHFVIKELNIMRVFRRSFE